MDDRAAAYPTIVALNETFLHRISVQQKEDMHREMTIIAVASDEDPLGGSDDDARDRIMHLGWKKDLWDMTQHQWKQLRVANKQFEFLKLWSTIKAKPGEYPTTWNIIDSLQPYHRGSRHWSMTRSIVRIENGGQDTVCSIVQRQIGMGNCIDCRTAGPVGRDCPACEIEAHYPISMRASFGLTDTRDQPSHPVQTSKLLGKAAHIPNVEHPEQEEPDLEDLETKIDRLYDNHWIPNPYDNWDELKTNRQAFCQKCDQALNLPQGTVHSYYEEEWGGYLNQDDKEAYHAQVMLQEYFY